MVESERTKHTCLRLEISGADPIFVKGTWHQSRFDISVTDGSSSWVCNAIEEEVADRAAQWDQPVSEYLELADQYLGFQQPNSIYSFSDAIEGCKRGDGDNIDFSGPLLSQSYGVDQLLERPSGGSGQDRLLQKMSLSSSPFFFFFIAFVCLIDYRQLSS